MSFKSPRPRHYATVLIVVIVTMVLLLLTWYYFESRIIAIDQELK